MPKQKPHVLLLSAGLVLLFGFTACVMAKTYIAYSKQLNRMAVIQTAFENMAFCRPYELSSEGFCLSPTTVLTDAEGNKSPLSEVVSAHGRTLVYRFSRMNCLPCIAMHFKLLKSILDDRAQMGLIILCDYHNARDLRILRNTYEVSCGLYSVDRIGIPIEDVNNPYFFILTQDMRCEGFFTAFKETSQQTENFLRALLEKL